MSKGYLSMLLHAHLPYVRHPEHEDFLEEDWLYEAITETYIPLLDMFESLTRDNIPWNMTLTMSGTLVNMLEDELLQNRYLNHLNKMLEFSKKEITRLKFKPDFLKVAEHNKNFFEQAKYYFDRYNKNLLTGFKKFQDMGNLEIIPVTATHGFLPAMKDYEEAINAQVEMAKIDYKRVFQKEPLGMWLAECAYYPGQDEYLEKHGIKYFMVDSHGILFGDPKPVYGIYSPVYTESGVAAFGRDIESSEQVWSSEMGYPGDGVYREFHKDAAFDLPYDYVKEYLHDDGVRRNMGIKYYSITDKKGDQPKKVYDPELASNRAKEHAQNFIDNREKQVEHLSKYMKDRKPIILSPYDAELYGHWWYEGPKFLEELFRAMAKSDIVEGITPSGYLEETPKNQVVTPAASSWGANGYYDVWVDSSNRHIYRHLHKGAERMIELANKFENPSDLERRALDQAARELMMAQTSCWPFIMFTGTMVGYAEKNIRDHINRLFKLYFELKENRIDENWLSEIEYRDNIFPTMDYKIYKSNR
ncbi:MAG: glycoside hydrolase family 57 protein [Fusobacteriota bacterium]